MTSDTDAVQLSVIEQQSNDSADDGNSTNTHLDTADDGNNSTNIHLDTADDGNNSTNIHLNKAPNCKNCANYCVKFLFVLPVLGGLIFFVFNIVNPVVKKEVLGSIIVIFIVDFVAVLATAVGIPVSFLYYLLHNIPKNSPVPCPCGRHSKLIWIFFGVLLLFWTAIVFFGCWRSCIQAQVPCCKSDNQQQPSWSDIAHATARVSFFLAASPLFLTGFWNMCVDLDNKNDELNRMLKKLENEDVIALPKNSFNHKALEMAITTFIGATIVYSFAYFVYWFIGLLNQPTLPILLEIIDWVLPIMMTLCLLIFGTVVNYNACLVKEKGQIEFAKSKDIHNLYISTNFSWEISLYGLDEPIHFKTILKFLLPQLVVAVVKYIIDHYIMENNSVVNGTNF